MRESPRSSAPRRFRGAPGGTHSFVALVLLLLATARLQSLRGLTVTVTGQIEEDEHGSALSEAASLSSGTGEVQPPPLLAGAAAPRRPLRILMLGHDLTLSGAPLALLELGTHLRNRGHAVSFMFLRNGELEPALKQANFHYSFIEDIQVQRYVQSDPVDPDSFDVVVVNTVVTWRWIQHQMEAWGLAFMRKVVWWIRELPVGNRGHVHAYTEGEIIKRHIMARCAAVPFASEVTWRWWETWVLEQSYELGLDYSPLVGRQESTQPWPPLPAALPSLRPVRNPLPAWMMPLLERPPRSDGSPGGQPECSRASEAWPHAALRQEFRQRIGATDADHVVFFVGNSAPHKKAAHLVRAFARAWSLDRKNPRAPGRLLLLMAGAGIPDLANQVQLQWARIQRAASNAGPAALAAVEEGGGLPAAVFLLGNVANTTERLGWYTAGDAQVLNAECEAFGRVTVEGMGASLPMLATSCGGSLEIVQDGVTGLLHTPPTNNTAAHEELVSHLLAVDRRTPAGRALGERMGAAGCRSVHAEFQPQLFLAAAEAVIRRVAVQAAAAEAAAAAGLGAAPGEGLTLKAAAGLPSGWTSAFMPVPANQARVLGRDMQWEWEELPPAPVFAQEITSFQLGNTLLILGGTKWRDDRVVQPVRTIDLDTLVWRKKLIEMPTNLAGMRYASALVGGRYVFMVSGQTDAACAPETAAAYRLDLHSMELRSVPSLPQPRHAPVVSMLGDGRLHVFGGLLPDRSTPARDHWSLAINPDGSTEDAWAAEPLLPAFLGGAHGAAMQLQPQGAAEPALYYWGRISQEARPRNTGEGDYSCTTDREWGDAALWSYNLRRGWRRHRDLPLPLLHAGSCTLKLGQDSALVVGGQHYKGWLSRFVWLYNATEDSWARVGQLPLHARGQACALHAGRLFVTLGQQGLESGLSPETGPLSARQFVAQLPPELADAAAGGADAA